MNAVRALLVAVLASAPATAADHAPPLPAPDLSAVEPAVRRQLEAAQERAARKLSDPDETLSARAESVGALGRLYLLYSLLDSAEACFRQALELSPGEFRWSYYLATILQRAGRFPEAAKTLDTALAARPRDLPSLLRLGQVEIGRGRPREAAAAFQKALVVDPASAAALHGLAQVAALDGDHTTAARLFESVLETQPEASTAHYQLGLALRRLGDLERARFHLERQGRGEVVFPDPLLADLAALAEGAAIRIAQATRARGRGDLATARGALESAVRADPENLTARLALASNLIEQNLLDAAVAQLEEVLRRDPGNAAAHYNLGTAVARAGRVETAIEHLGRAVELAPRFADAQVNLAGLLRGQGRYEEAVEAFERALAIEPEDVSLRLQRAESLDRAGRSDEASAALSEAAPNAAGDAALLLLLGQIREGRDETEKAVAAYRGAVALPSQPEAALAARRLARLETMEGSPEAALELLDTALELRPGWTEALSDRALVNGRLGRFAAAAADFRLVVEKEPDDEPARVGRTVALLLDSDYSEALAHLEASLAALPESIALRHSLARLLATCPDAAVRDGQRALTLAQEVASRERSLEHGQTVAMALAEVGRFDDATRLQAQILDFAERSGATAALAALRRRLAAYERGEPVRAPWLEGQPAG